MLRLKEVQAENCLLFPAVHYDVRHQGVVLVTGENRMEEAGEDASNAAGKSALFELIPMALFDRATRGSTKDTWVLDPQKPLTLRVAFAVNGDDYEVIWRRQPGRQSLTLRKNGRDITPRGGIPQARKLLQNEILPLDEESYYSIVHLTPARVSQFIEGSPQTRYAYLARLLGLDQLDALRERLQKELAAARSEPLLPAAEYKKQLAEVEKALTPPPNVAPLRRWLRWFERWYEEELKTASRYRQILAQRHLFARARRFDAQRLAALRRLVVEWQARAVRLDKPLQDHRLRRQKQAKLAEIYQRYPDLPRTVAELKAELQKAEETITGLKVYAKVAQAAAEVKEKTGVDILAATEQDFARWEEEARRVARELGKLDGRLEALEDEIVRLDDLAHHTVCPTCGQKVDRKVLARTRRRLARSKELLLAQHRRLNAKYQDLKRKQQAAALFRHAQSTLARVPSYVPELYRRAGGRVADVVRRLEELRARLHQALHYHETMALLPEHDPRTIRHAQRALKALDRRLARAYRLLEELEEAQRAYDRLTALGWDPRRDVAWYRRAAEEAERRAAALRRVLERWRTAVERGRAQRRAYHGAWRRYQRLWRDYQRARRRERKIKHLQDLLAFFSPKGLKKRVVNTYLTNLVHRLNYYGSFLFKNTRFTIRTEKNALHVLYQSPRRSGDIRYMSTGQRRRLAVAVVPALVSVLPPWRRANVLILDEVDANVDRVGVARLDAFLPRLKEQFETVFVITPHRDHFTRYDAHWHVVRHPEGHATLTSHAKPSGGREL